MSDSAMNNSDNTTARIGIMGGSFDPVHLGHAGLAKDALCQVFLDSVVIVPAGKQPFKQDMVPASGEDRMNMLRIAFAGEPKITISSFELDRDEVSYTYLTLRAMQEEMGKDAKLYFIIGTDSLLKLETWMNSEELLERYSYIVGSRPGYRDAELEETMKSLKERYGTEIIKISNTRYDISSTEIRELAAGGKSIDHLVGKGVERYIDEHGLYGRGYGSF